MSDRIIHEVDGIQEADNQLPRWWLYTLYGAMLFAACYWFWYHGFKQGKLPIDRYREDQLAAAEKEAEALRAQGPMTIEKLSAMSQNAAIVAGGKATFVAICASCHGPSAAGLVGPNLTDEYWLHGGAPLAVLTSIRNGYADKGMPSWGPQLGEEKVREVAAYVITLKNRNVPGGKAPQGVRE